MELTDVETSQTTRHLARAHRDRKISGDTELHLRTELVSLTSPTTTITATAATCWLLKTTPWGLLIACNSFLFFLLCNPQKSKPLIAQNHLPFLAMKELPPQPSSYDAVYVSPHHLPNSSGQVPNDGVSEKGWDRKFEASSQPVRLLATLVYISAFFFYSFFG